MTSRVRLCVGLPGDRLRSCRQAGGQGEGLAPRLSAPGGRWARPHAQSGSGTRGYTLRSPDADVTQQTEERQPVG
ncbi:hypothetical protein SGRIM128S_02374 [Streptomyces griseomycini]